jgi:hypothetical protein
MEVEGECREALENYTSIFIAVPGEKFHKIKESYSARKPDIEIPSMIQGRYCYPNEFNPEHT